MIPLEYEVWNPWPAVWAFAIFIGLVIFVVVVVDLMRHPPERESFVSSIEGEIVARFIPPSEPPVATEKDLFDKIEEYRNDFPESAVVNLEDARGQLAIGSDCCGGGRCRGHRISHWPGNV